MGRSGVRADLEGSAGRRLEENNCNLLFREGSKEGSVLNTNTRLEAAVLRVCV